MARAPKTFLVIYHAPQSMMNKMQKMSAEEVAASHAAWMKWAEKCGDKLIEMGAPLHGGLKLAAGADPVPSKRKVTGYSLVHAATMAGAKRLMKGHPHLTWGRGCEIEIHEAVNMGK